MAPVRDMALLDPFNPRSVAFQVNRIEEGIATLPVLRRDGILEEPKRLTELSQRRTDDGAARVADDSRILAVEQSLLALANAIAARYFLQGANHGRAEKVTGIRVIYTITHVTRYTYGATVELTNEIVRLTPVSRDGQTLERFDLVTAPPSLPPTERVDPFGNIVLSLRIEKPHRELSVTAVSRVRVDRPAAPEESPPWETVAAEALAINSLENLAVPHPLFIRRAVSRFSTRPRPMRG